MSGKEWATKSKRARWVVG